MALGAALLIGWIGLRFHEREDTVIGALWAIGMAGGLLLLDLTPGYFNASSYLFGDILLISPEDLRTVLLLDGLILGVVALWYRQLLATAFDAEFALLRGIPVEFLHLLLLCLTALTVVLMVRIVGIILVVALLTLPAAVAAQYTRRFLPMMILAVLLCLFFTGAGLALSYLPQSFKRSDYRSPGGNRLSGKPRNRKDPTVKVASEKDCDIDNKGREQFLL